MAIDWQKINSFGRTPKGRAGNKNAKPGDKAPKKQPNLLATLSFGRKKPPTGKPQPTALAASPRGSMSRMVARDSGPAGLGFGADEPNDESTEEFLSRAQGPTKQEMITKGVMIAAIVALVCGPLALLLSFGGGKSKATAPPPPVSAVDTGAEARAIDLARQFVPVWAGAAIGDEAKLAPYLSISNAGLLLPSKPQLSVSDPQAVSIHKNRTPPEWNDQDTYTVTIAGLTRQLGTELPQSRRHYQVTVAVIGQAARAVALPRPVSAPDYQFDLTLNYPSSVSEGDLKNTVQSFLNALLCGVGDVRPLVEGRASIAPVRPIAARFAELRDLKSTREIRMDATPQNDETVQVLATVNLTNVENSTGISAQYPISLKGFDRKWVITALDGAPRTRKLDGVPAPAPPAGGAGDATSSSASSVTATKSSGAMATSSAPAGAPLTSAPPAPATSARPTPPPAPTVTPSRLATPLKLPTVPAGPIFN